jgi:hypothetical protein
MRSAIIDYWTFLAQDGATQAGVNITIALRPTFHFAYTAFAGTVLVCYQIGFFEFGGWDDLLPGNLLKFPDHFSQFLNLDPDFNLKSTDTVIYHFNNFPIYITHLSLHTPFRNFNHPLLGKTKKHNPFRHPRRTRHIFRIYVFYPLRP